MKRFSVALTILLLASPAIAQTNCGTALCNRLTPVGGNTVGANLTNSELAVQLDTCLAQIALLQQEVVSLRGQCRQCKDGQDGSSGKQGPKGQDGANGKDATVDYPKIWKWLTDHKSEFVGPKGDNGISPTIDIDKIVPQVIAKLPPIDFVEVDHAGTVLSSNPVALGHKVKFSPFTVNYLDGTGKTLDSEYVQPFGGTLNLHIDVLKK